MKSAENALKEILEVPSDEIIKPIENHFEQLGG
jgi:hypothetical protein